jgi:uncharacterized repeat protein (TIGR01451 family)
MLVVRMGGRLLLTPEELAHGSVPGTILHPDEKVIAPAAAPPCLLPDPHAFIDPRLGPKPLDDECVHDGGDHGERAGLDPAGNLYGLDPEDTIAEFTDSKGRRHLTCSNRVCLCVPRFGVLRVVTPPNSYDSVLGPADTRKILGQQQVLMGQPSLEAEGLKVPGAVRGRERPSQNVGVKGPVRLDRVEVLEAQLLNLGPITLIGTKAIQTLTEIERTRLLRQIEFARELSGAVAPREEVGMKGTAVVGRVEGLQVVSAQATTRDITVCCEELPCPPDKPLILVKCADRTSAQPGDVVTFMLRYSNHGLRPITDVAVSDSLSPRLEYVPGSAQADRPAVFTTQLNEAGSQILRWEVSGTLQPGQSGALRFQARVR